MAATTGMPQHQQQQQKQRRMSEIELYCGQLSTSPQISSNDKNTQQIRTSSSVKINPKARTENYILCTDMEAAIKAQGRRSSASNLEVKHFHYALNQGAFNSATEKGRKRRKKSFDKSKKWSSGEKRWSKGEEEK